jgi:6-hydroxymethylpterin diphosphokinase MptE-like protein
VLDVFTTWRGLLVDLGELGDALCRAIETDDVLTAVATMMQMRRVRSALGRVEAPLRVTEDAAVIAEMARVAEHVIRAKGAEAVMHRWMSRPLPGDARLLASPLGIAVLADAMLPPVWDFEIDLVILAGAELAPVGELLGDLGQRRILISGADSLAAIRVEDADEVSTAVRTLVPDPPTQMIVRATTGADADEVQRTVDAAKQALSDLRIHRNTVRAFSRTWIEQGTANLPAISRWPSVASLDGEFRGVPMVIIAPGPSLANNIAQIRELQGRAIITAFSHSLKPVLAAGIVPDLILTVDPQDVRYHFAGCDLSRSCLVNAATVHPSLFELSAARFVTLSANCAIDDWIFDGLGENALVPGGGSVATSAFSLALRWGCDPIIFVGLDLSFPGGAYYVGTSSDGGARARVDNGIVRVVGWSADFRAMKAQGGPSAAAERAVELPGWDGGTVPSSFMFALFHRWFVDRMKFVEGTTVYNCTEGGAYIDGMQHRALSEVISKLAGTTVDVAAAIDRIVTATTASDRANKLGDHLGGFVTGLRRCRTLAQRARKAIAAGDTGGRLERIERELVDELAPLGFASLLAQREVDRARDIARRDGTSADFLAATATLLDALDGVIDQLEPRFAAAQGALR